MATCQFPTKISLITLTVGLIFVTSIFHNGLGLGLGIQNQDGNIRGNLKHIKTETDADTQTRAGQEVIRRLLPQRHTEFSLRVNSALTETPYSDSFTVRWDASINKVVLTGTTAVTALYGFNYYLKYFCKCQVAWEGSQLDLPSILPKVNLTLEIVDRFRYYQNVCTDSYSFAWWDWAQWEEHIDWMALNGINLPLAFTGQEAIWHKIYTQLGLPTEDVDEYITGPAFLAWWRMGNIQKWGGPIPKNYISQKHDILLKIVERMKSLGMIPVLPAFSGNVPRELTKIFPNASVVHHSSWNSFNSSYSSNYMLLPTDPLFIEIGQRFIQELVEDVGTGHIYSCDTFNENRPIQNDSTFLHQMAASTFASMTAGDAKAVWMIQSWVFTDTGFWKKDQIKSYLSGVEEGNALILDLEAELFPLYPATDSFFNHNFIWCMLHNFGGNHGLYGALNLVNQGVPAARQGNKNYVGSGMCPEGINQNFFIYDFMSEASLRNSTVNVTQWALDYQERRYGSSASSNTREAWKILSNKIYNAPPMLKFHGATLITRRPGFTLREKIWYNIDDVYQVLKLFVKPSSSNNTTTSSILTSTETGTGTRTGTGTSLFRFDVVDLTRQFLQVLSCRIYNSLLGYYFIENVDRFDTRGIQLLNLLDDLNAILSTDKQFLLGPWVADAERWGNTTEEKDLLRYNALNQITLWGPNGEIVDYAAKQWAGVVSDYYKPRWAFFIIALRETVGSTFNYAQYKSKLLRFIETPFTTSKTLYPTVPSGDSIVEATRIFHKWDTLYQNYVRKSILRRNSGRRSKIRILKKGKIIH